MVILLDSSVLIEFARTKKGNFLNVLEEIEEKSGSLITSTLVICEFWSGESMKSKKAEHEAAEIFQQIKAIPVNEIIAKKAGELRRIYKLQIADALIAATAIDSNAQLATLNIKHFKNVPGLTVWQPKSAP